MNYSRTQYELHLAAERNRENDRQTYERELVSERNRDRTYYELELTKERNRDRY